MSTTQLYISYESVIAQVLKVVQHIIIWYNIKIGVMGRTAYIYSKLIEIACRGVKATKDDGSVAISLNITGVVNKTLHVWCAVMLTSNSPRTVAVASSGLSQLWFFLRILINEAIEAYQLHKLICHR
ncbi:hypothetical protein QL285_056601 [Trifolium repens]|nr:hypothetical protein QL285_056601 [Trifolium repens]